MFKIFYAIVLSDLRMFFRNRLALFWMIVFPFLLFAILFGAFGGPSTLGTIRLEIVDRDETSESRLFVTLLKRAFAAAQAVDLDVRFTGGEGSALPGELRLDLPRGFGQAIRNSQNAEVTISAGKGNTFAQKTAIGIILGANAEYNVLSAKLPNRSGIIVVQERSGLTITYGQYLAVGIIVMTIISTCLMGFSIPIVTQREQGILNTYAILPVTRIAVLSAFSVSRLILIVAFAVLFMSTVKVVFHVDIPVSLAGFFESIAILLLVTWMFLALGLIIAGRVGSVASAGALTNLIYFSLAFLGNLIVPIDRFPDWIRAATAFLPSALAATSLRDSLYGNSPGVIEAHWIVLAGLAGWTIVCTAVAAKAFRWGVK